MARLAAQIVVLAVVSTVVLLIPTRSTAAAATAGSVTVRLSETRARVGTVVTVTGRAPALRSALLEMRTGGNGWQVLDRAVTGATGYFRFAAPDWYGVHRLRVRVLGTAVAPPVVSATRTLRMVTPYRPKGAATDWGWLGQPGARWDPCETITYQLNPQGGYPEARHDLARAVASLSAITGIQFRDRGSTTAEVRRGHRGYHPPDIDIVLDWQSPQQEPGLSGGVAGIGGSWVLSGRRFDGYVLLDSSQRLERDRWRQVITHELGHVLGLGHAAAPTQVMHGTSSSRNRRWGAGDLAGLTRLGASQGCLS